MSGMPEYLLRWTKLPMLAADVVIDFVWQTESWSGHLEVLGALVGVQRRTRKKILCGSFPNTAIYY